jgi:hypothetical protein
MDLRVLTWDVFHGRATPSAGRDLSADVAAALAGWEWDVALLQQAPPWWLAQLRRAHGVALACGVWVANLHASAGPAAARDLREAVRVCTAWARPGRLPVILGGVADVSFATTEPLRKAACAGADHVLCDPSIEIRAASVATPEHGTLCGRAPLAVTLVI